MASWSDTEKWSAEQLVNANTIIRVGRQLGASQRDIAIALATAIQESSLINMKGGDRDSAGLFQQRPSMGWGSLAQVSDPEYAARTFFQGKPGNPGLFSIKNRDQLSITEAAQKVQRSAYPDAYAAHENAAFKLLGVAPAVAKEVAPASKVMNWVKPASPASVAPAVVKAGTQAAMPLAPTPALTEAPGSTPKAAGTGAAGTPAGAGAAAPVGTGALNPIGAGDVLDYNPLPDLPPLDRSTFNATFGAPAMAFGADGLLAPASGAGVVSTAQSFIGTPYMWGGNGHEGVDCSGLVQQVYASQGINLPRLSADQARSGARIGLGDLRPGDLVAWDDSARNNGADHIAIYVGNGQIIEAPRPGLNVRARKLGGDYDSGAYGVRLSKGN